jgi:hypothetical protein
VAYLRCRAVVEVDVKEAVYVGMINLVASSSLLMSSTSVPRWHNRAGPASARGGAHRVRPLLILRSLNLQG